MYWKQRTSVGVQAGGSWPGDYTVTKCSEYTSTTPIPRDIDLAGAIAVRTMLCIMMYLYNLFSV